MRLALPRVRAARALSPLLAIALVLAAASTAAASEFPAGKQGYHSYTEMAADVAAVAAAHPDIVSRFSIGKSYQGRDLWAVKISDNVNVDEAEPEVMFDGGHHADEHMSTEMTLHILHWLVDGYGVDPRITAIVDSREIWIVFMVNPDGVEYDISGGRFHNWRKNRQPTPGTSSIGTDLNRNYGYRWGGGGRTSANPADITYRGTAAFSTPEDRAMRAFLASRVVGGRQQIRTAITFHESGRLVMWPYGYTMTDVPGDMTYQDHAALALMGRTMASDERLQAGAGQRPVHQLGHEPRLPIRRLPDLHLHVRDVRRGLSRRFADRGGDRPQQGSRPVRDGARCVPARGPRPGGPDHALRRVRRRPRGQQRLDREPGRHGHGAGQRTVRSRQPGLDVEQRTEAARDDHVRLHGHS